MVKKILSIVLLTVFFMSFTATSYASDVPYYNNDQMVSAYRNVITYAKAHNIPMDLSFDVFIHEYEKGNYSNIDDYEQVYYDILSTSGETIIDSYIVGSSKWYYSTGTSLPQAADYSKYNLLNTIKKGDLVYESKGGFGITGHIAIVEGVYFSSTQNQYYIRVIEAINKGVVRSVLDDERVDDKGVSILRVPSTSSNQINNVISFCVGQLGKEYGLDFKKDTSPNELDWYCSELAWAAFYNQGIDIETDALINEPGITPRDIKNSDSTIVVSYK